MNKSELRQLIRECINNSGIKETTDPREVNVFGYQQIILMYVLEHKDYIEE